MFEFFSRKHIVDYRVIPVLQKGLQQQKKKLRDEFPTEVWLRAASRSFAQTPGL
jgi:hypothetical protein